jgi:hypothetical protein
MGQNYFNVGGRGLRKLSGGWSEEFSDGTLAGVVVYLVA